MSRSFDRTSLESKNYRESVLYVIVKLNHKSFNLLLMMIVWLSKFIFMVTEDETRIKRSSLIPSRRVRRE